MAIVKCFNKCRVLTLLLLLSAFPGFTLQDDQPTYSQCRVHIEAAIKGIDKDSTPPASIFETISTHEAEEPAAAQEAAAPEEEAYEEVGSDEVYEEFQAAAEETPEAAEQASESVEEEPEASEDAPEVVEEAPETADEVEEAPEAAVEAVEEAPETAEEAPVAAEEAVEEAPVAAEEAPDATVEEAPEAAEEAVEEAPEAAEEAVEEAPEAAEEAPEAAEAVEEAPEAAEAVEEAAEQVPEAVEEAAEQVPEAVEEAPEAAEATSEEVAPEDPRVDDDDEADQSVESEALEEAPVVDPIEEAPVVDVTEESNDQSAESEALEEAPVVDLTEESNDQSAESEALDDNDQTVESEPLAEAPVVDLIEEDAVPAAEAVLDLPAPVEELPAPAQEVAAPAEEPPVIEAPVPVTEEPVVAEAAATVTDEPPVVVEAPAPVVEAPAPAPVEDPAEGVIEEAPEERRSRAHIDKTLRLDKDVEDKLLRNNYAIMTLKEVKRVVENAVRPLESIFKYNDVSNRNFGDSEIFSKPLVLFLGPWSGGKSTIINYLLGTEYTANALKSGAEPSATFFQILMHGEEEEQLDGTQLAADWTFSGLQKFGQAFIDRLRGKRLPNKILEKANVVEVPGILEVRKQVDRPYPFNDVVQWFIDRADLIFVVYDPTKLDTGLEHEALFDQLKGRQSQVRVLLNKADSVTQEELLLIQNNLVWNLSPLMASALPPTLYAGSFWSRPYKPDAPVRLLKSHEENMLTDLREALDSMVENTIAEARRHAVRVRNHAKMVDCYLTTFYNHKGYFGNSKKVADEIIENPHSYHIFEGLSTLNNISRYDLPDADVYKDFFRLHPLYNFKPLASTCTFFRGCPLDKLDTAIAYELPELVGKYKKRIQSIGQPPTSKKSGKH